MNFAILDHLLFGAGKAALAKEVARIIGRPIPPALPNEGIAANNRDDESWDESWDLSRSGRRRAGEGWGGGASAADT
jgi:hypothetical protein